MDALNVRILSQIEGCKFGRNIIYMEYEIQTGRFVKIKRGFMKASLNVMYCGMLDENTFVLSPLMTKGYQGFSPNIYYRTDARVIQILDKDFEVLELTSDYIVIGD